MKKYLILLSILSCFFLSSCSIEVATKQEKTNANITTTAAFKKLKKDEWDTALDNKSFVNCRLLFVEQEVDDGNVIQKSYDVRMYGNILYSDITQYKNGAKIISLNMYYYMDESGTYWEIYRVVGQGTKYHRNRINVATFTAYSLCRLYDYALRYYDMVYDEYSDTYVYSTLTDTATLTFKDKKLESVQWYNKNNSNIMFSGTYSEYGNIKLSLPNASDIE